VLVMWFAQNLMYDYEPGLSIFGGSVASHSSGFCSLLNWKMQCATQRKY